jgi:GrpB-like predicted nucleotidyltransferase (UPF0157 family)
MPTDVVHFVPETECRAKAEALFATQSRRLGDLLPSAEIHHIGSTSIPDSLTKGDLDILVRVHLPEFRAAEAILASHYQRNLGSDRTPEFATFKDDSLDPPLGIQLAAIGGPHDHFLAFRDALLANPELLTHYNQLKRDFYGKPMDEYRAAKSAFVEQVLKQRHAMP